MFVRDFPSMFIRLSRSDELFRRLNLLIFLPIPTMSLNLRDLVCFRCRRLGIELRTTETSDFSCRFVSIRVDSTIMVAHALCNATQYETTLALT